MFLIKVPTQSYKADKITLLLTTGRGLFQECHFKKMTAEHPNTLVASHRSVIAETGTFVSANQEATGMFPMCSINCLCTFLYNSLLTDNVELIF